MRNVKMQRQNLKGIQTKLSLARIDVLLTRKNNFFVLPAVLLLLNVADVLSTRWGLTIGLVEMNPLFSFAAIPLKFMGWGILFVASYLQNRLAPTARGVRALILCIAIAQFIVVTNNIYWIFKA
jgi:hypothetical protein